jgi:hypothetical protein
MMPGLSIYRYGTLCRRLTGAPAHSHKCINKGCRALQGQLSAVVARGFRNDDLARGNVSKAHVVVHDSGRVTGCRHVCCCWLPAVAC